MRKRIFSGLVIMAVLMAILAGGSFAEEGLTVGANGDVGIGITTPGAKLDINLSKTNSDDLGLYIQSYPHYTSTGDHYTRGQQIVIRPNAAAGIQNTGYAIGEYITVTDNTGGTGTISSLNGESITFGITTGGASTITDARGITINPYHKGGTIQNMYSLYLNTPSTGGTVNNRWALYSPDTANSYFQGSLGIGTANPEKKLHVTGGGIGLDHNQWIWSKDSTGEWRTLMAKDENNDTKIVTSTTTGIVLAPGNAEKFRVSRYLAKVDSSANLGLGAVLGSNVSSVFGIGIGVEPQSSPADMIQLYAKDFNDGDGTSTAELFVRDEDGHATDLSPHIFALYKPDPNEALPWSYYSENSYIGKRVNVDMAGAVREIEKLSGKKFIYYEDIPKTSPMEEKRRIWKENWISQNTTEVEIPKNNAFETVTVDVEDQGKVEGEKISYQLEGDNVVEVKNPIYAKIKVQKKQLREGVRFCTETGKFFEKKVPTDEQAEQAASGGFEMSLSGYIKERM